MWKKKLESCLVNGVHNFSCIITLLCIIRVDIVALIQNNMEALRSLLLLTNGKSARSVAE